ncbi:MAG: redoxin family protein [Bacteroidota bacterium]
MKNKSFSLVVLCLLMTFHLFTYASPGKVIVNGMYIKNDSCRNFTKKLPPGVILQMNDPCAIECRWFPVNDRENISIIELNPDSKGEFHMELPAKSLSFMTIHSVYHGRSFYVYPGDTLWIMINDKDTANPFSYKARYDPAQELYVTQAPRWNSCKGFERWRKPLNDNLLRYYQVYVDSCLKPYTSLSRENSCTREFFDFVSTDIRYDAAYQLSQTLWSRYEFDSLSASDKTRIIGLLDKLYADTPLLSRNIITPCGTGFTDYILTWIWLQYLKAGNITDKYKGPPSLLTGKLQMVKSQLTPGAYELFAMDLIDTHAQRMDTIALYAFEQLKKEYPKLETDYEKNYKSTLANIQHLLDFMEASRVKTSQGIRFIDGAKINTFEDLAALFPGRKVYVDMWATWCSPCLKLFEYNTRIRDFLKEHDITEVFLSLDKDSVKWKTAVKYYRLEGANIMASQSLRKDLIKALDWNGGIPRFFIISRDGKLQEKDAFQPVAKDKLMDQLLKQK